MAVHSKKTITGKLRHCSVLAEILVLGLMLEFDRGHNFFDTLRYQNCVRYSMLNTASLVCIR